VNILDDHDVLEMISGSKPAFITLYNKYKQPIYVFCLKMVGDRDAAMDIVQELFLKVYERRNQILQPASFKSWLYSIARNDCLSYFRKINRHEYFDDEKEFGKDERQISPSHRLESEDETDLLNSAIERLKIEYREVVLLREYQNLSYAEIADVIGIDDGLVKSRLFAARRQLYEMLKEFFPERNRICNAKNEHKR
jgi:RNA polymerase sigma-70 factor, ECF subfamily